MPAIRTHRETGSFIVPDNKIAKAQILKWVNLFEICAFFDNNNYKESGNSYECIAAAGCISSFIAGEKPFPPLNNFLKQSNDWLFGHFNYDLKNEIEDLSSQNPDPTGFPEIFLFQPEVVITLCKNVCTIHCVGYSPGLVWKELNKQKPATILSSGITKVVPQFTKQNYLQTVSQLKQHIHRGDCYEINYCQHFFAAEVKISPVETFEKLNAISPAPFAAFYKLENKYLFCASPERYIKKTGSTLISQPMKGTAARDLKNGSRDEILKQALKQSKKEQSENIMIVDLVRNDLSKICLPGSVHVKDLFNVYSFSQVHQMVSTIYGKVDVNKTLAEILQATFPMGSMTGAPKKRVMELIEQYENFKRGIFSGSVGYITPEKDFDFNVVIRSIMHDDANKTASFMAGSAITFYADAEKEYKEILLKSRSMQQVFSIE